MRPTITYRLPRSAGRRSGLDLYHASMRLEEARLGEAARLGHRPRLPPLVALVASGTDAQKEQAAGALRQFDTQLLPSRGKR